MKTQSASSTVNYLKLINDHGPGMMLRGQGDADWKILPSIARYASNVSGYTSLCALEIALLSRFRQFGMPFFDFRKISLLEQLVHAQHYGLPTRLLDWSTNPLKALFFAVEDCSLDKKDGAVYITSPNSWINGTSESPDQYDFHAFIPEILHERVAAQDACLISFPLSKQDMNCTELSSENLPPLLSFLQKITIPASSKKPLRRQLSILGINHRTVYPGLEGTTRWIKSDLSGYTI